MGNRAGSSQQRDILDNGDVKAWVSRGPDKTLMEKVEIFGKALKDEKLSTSQIRHVFTRLKGIEARGYSDRKVDFMMLKPLMAYAASRHSSIKGLRLLKDKISLGIDEVLSAPEGEELQYFKNFCRFFEAVLAYHRAAGGK